MKASGQSIRRCLLVASMLASASRSPAQIWVKSIADVSPGKAVSTQRSPDGVVSTMDSSKLTSWLPANGGKEKAQYFWRQPNTEFLTANDFVTTPGTVSNTSELVADLLGPVRLAASTAVVGSTGTSATGKESADRNLNLLRANGGNLALSGIYPLLIRGVNGPLVFEADTLTRMSANIAALGGTNDSNQSSVDFDKVNANTEISLETRSSLVSNNSVFKFFAYTRTGAIIASKVFRETIGSRHSTFIIGEAGLSARVGQLFTVGVTWGWYSDARIPRQAGAFHIALSK